MIDHMNLPVGDVKKAKTFYDAVLAALGYHQIAEDADAVGYGIENWNFGLVPTDGSSLRLHIAFVASSRAKVDLFHETAIASGGLSNGAPGHRPNYGPVYYAAYVIDPDGHNIEAVFRG